MQNKRYPLLIQGQKYSPEDQWREAFAPQVEALYDGIEFIEALCLCRKDNDLAPSVMIKRRSERSGFTYIRSPGTGNLHAPSCVFHSPHPDLTGLSSYNAHALRETSEGNFRIILRKKLRPSSDTQQLFDSTDDPKIKAFGLKGLLHLIWSESRLNLWFDHDKCNRRLGIVNAAIRKVAGRIISQETPLDRSLVLHAPFGSQQEQTNNDVISSSLALNSKLLLIGPLKSYNINIHESKISKLPVTGNFGFSAIFIGAKHWNHFLEEYPKEVGLWKDGHTVIALARLSPQNDGLFKIAQVRDLTLMAVSKAWVPVISQSDLAKESALRAERVSFIKPLRFDAPDDVDLPDFLIADGDGYQPVKIPV
ncbi:DUF1173 family protein [Pseudomonas fluorescens]|uniref:DUF1173 family protein n=1 Tax=Pseudomonas fluorescens TaxID=294 RepID=UPI0010D86091|nr:DUF1173 family protein [Pseudomonas fluorescens]TCV62738.1 uncharacterized protein DUF1173 [Pseudomonas fluorescens]